MSGEFLTMTLAAGETKQFAKAGKYFELIADGGSTFNFNFYGPNGAQSANWKNCQAGLFLEDPYSAFDVTNNSAGMQSITMLLMDNGRGGSRRQPGVVQVVDSSKATTMAASAFTANGSNAAVAAQYGSIQFWNPALSGRRIVVESLTINNSTAGAIGWGIGFNGAGLTYTGGGVGSAANKLSGGGASLVVVNQSNNVGQDPVNVMPQSVVYGGTAGANSSVVIKPNRPLVILPNYGLMLGVRTLNSALGVVAEYYEESNS